MTRSRLAMQIAKRVIEFLEVSFPLASDSNLILLFASLEDGGGRRVHGYGLEGRPKPYQGQRPCTGFIGPSFQRILAASAETPRLGKPRQAPVAPDISSDTDYPLSTSLIPKSLSLFITHISIRRWDRRRVILIFYRSQQAQPVIRRRVSLEQ